MSVFICHSPIAMQGGILLTLVTAGLVGSVTHCTGMCGPFVMAMTPNVGNDAPALQRVKGALLLPYHLGRITTYMVLGFLAAALTGKVIETLQSNWLSAALLALGGGLFLMQYLGMSGLKFDIPSLPRALQKVVTNLGKNPIGWRGYATGIILGFLPCGLLLSALLIAAAAPEWWMGGVGMALFGLATMPSLNAVALIKNHVLSKKPEWMGVLRKGLTLANALVLFFLAGVRLT